MARQAARSLAPVLPPRRTDDLALLVTELVGNSVRHVDIADNAVAIELLLYTDLLRVEVGDRGQGFEPSQQRDALSPSGWGLILIERIADRWGVEKGGPTRVWFELNRSDVDRPAALAS
jgi:anti-sigma regulatory factor (Ser/Thr protein kinase)